MNWEDILKVGFIPADAGERQMLNTGGVNWMDAFDKYGFDDGHENNGQTEAIAQYLRRYDLEVNVLTGGHNTYIRSVLQKEPQKGVDNYKQGITLTGEIHFGVGGRSPERKDFSPKLLELLDKIYGKSTKSSGIAR